MRIRLRTGDHSIDAYDGTVRRTDGIGGSVGGGIETFLSVMAKDFTYPEPGHVVAVGETVTGDHSDLKKKGGGAAEEEG